MNVRNIPYRCNLRGASNWHFPLGFYQVAYFNTQLKFKIAAKHETEIVSLAVISHFFWLCL